MERVQVKVRRKRAGKVAKRLTDVNVAALVKRRDRAYWCWDHPRDVGLAVLVQPTGAKSYHCHFQRGPGLPMKSLKLGNVSEMTVGAAREAARKMRQSVAAGLDPRAGDVRRTDTFKDMVDDWYNRSVKGKVSGKHRRDKVLYHCKAWHQLPAGTIKQADVEARLQAVMDEVSAESARSLQNTLRTVFEWAAEDEEAYPGITRNPVKRAGSYGWLPEKKRREYDWFKGELADTVLKVLWQHAETLPRDEQVFIKLLVLTGKRINAVCAIDWRQIDREWLWTPIQVDDAGNRKKKKLNNPVPLPKLAREVLGERGEGKVLQVDAQDLLECVRKAAAVPDTFIWHGLRHLIKTRLAQLRLALPHVRDAITDHVDSSRSAAGRGYEHGEAMDEVAEALERWADHVAKVVGANVVEFPAVA